MNQIKFKRRWVLSGIFLFLAWIVLFLWTPSNRPEYSICFFHRLTGMACPGCGMTRAAAALAKGHFTESVRFHPLIPLVCFDLLAVWLGWVLRDLRNVRLPQGLIDQVLVLQGFLFIAVWVVRFFSGTMPS